MQPKVELGVTYASVGGEDLKMDLYYPAESKTPTAAIVVIHGGAWMSGKREDMKAFCETAAAKGFFAATVTYRLAPKSKWPAMLDDVQTATRYLRANAAKYNIEPTRIGASGASAGGHLSLFLGLRDTRDPKPTLFPGVSSRVSAVFNLFGPVDLGQDFGPGLDMLYPSILGKSKADAGAELLKEISPLNFVDDTAPPIFTLQGTADTLVPVKQAWRLDEAMKAKHRVIETVIVEGMPHGVSTGKPEVDKKITEGLEKGFEFMKKHLAAV